MGKRVEYKQDLKKKSDNATTMDVVDVAVPLGYKRIIESLSLEDETNDCTEARVGYNRNGALHWWVSQESPQDSVLYWMDEHKVLEAGDILTIRFAGAGVDDELRVYVDGFTEKV